MTTGYVVEILGTDASAVRYFGTGRNDNKQLPHFWRSGKSLHEQLVHHTRHMSEERRKTYYARGTVLVIENLQNGLKSSSATRVPLPLWMANQLETNRIKKSGTIKTALYKILMPGQGMHASRIKYFGQPKSKFGRIFQSAGSLRVFLSRSLSDLMPGGRFDQAMVLELIYDADGIHVTKQNTYGAQQFYTQSSDSNKRWNKFIASRKPLVEQKQSVQSFERDLNMGVVDHVRYLPFGSKV